MDKALGVRLRISYHLRDAVLLQNQIKICNDRLLAYNALELERYFVIGELALTSMRPF